MCSIDFPKPWGRTLDRATLQQLTPYDGEPIHLGGGDGIAAGCSIEIPHLDADFPILEIVPNVPDETRVHACHDERWSLPADVWGRGEDFFWYCNWGTTQKTQLNKQHVAAITLYAKLIRSQARGRPYVINKYDFYRPRNMMAEAAALGMIAGAIAAPHGTKEDADVMARYCKFLDEHAEIFQNQKH